MSQVQSRFRITQFPLEGKTVFVRVDYNVPLNGKKIVDATKIKESLPTIQFLLQKNCKLIIATHLGRPEGKFVEQLRVAPLVKELRRLLPGVEIAYTKDCIGKDVRAKATKLKPGAILMLENLRFYEEEEKNDPAFAHTLAQLAQVYVNDAFATAHRAHASVEAITHFIPALAGFLLEKEIYYLQQALAPKRPAIWIMGGAKLSKVDLLTKALARADYILIGGALAFPFMRAQGKEIGMSKIDANAVGVAKKLLRHSQARKLIFPIDYAVAPSMDLRATRTVVQRDHIPRMAFALDIGPATVEVFEQYLRKAKTVVWNGPLGYFESARFAQGTRDIARYISKLTATTICGGGETEEVIRKLRLEHSITHVSTGGGASLEFLEGKKLPALVALVRNYQQFRKQIK